MNGALKWKLIAGFVLVFVAGGIAGAALGGFYARHLFFEIHRSGSVGDRMKERLRTELKLTPEQVAKVSPIVDKAAAQLHEIRRDAEQHLAFCQGLPHQPEIAMLEIAEPAMHELAGSRGGRAGEIALVAQQYA